MKVIIAGGRGFSDFELMNTKCNELLLESDEDIEIVSGTAKGADKMGEHYASVRGFAVKQFPANWDSHGKAAGYIRNVEMGNYCDIAIIFWDGESRGTKHMINIMKDLDKPHHIIMF